MTEDVASRHPLPIGRDNRALGHRHLLRDQQSVVGCHVDLTACLGQIGLKAQYRALPRHAIRLARVASPVTELRLRRVGQWPHHRDASVGEPRTPISIRCTQRLDTLIAKQKDRRIQGFLRVLCGAPLYCLILFTSFRP